MFRVQLSGASQAFECDANDTLLRGALRNGVPLTYECNSGGCGSCKFELVDGNVENLWPEAPALSPRDLRKGKLLACQCKPTENTTIKIGFESGEQPRFLPQRFTAVLKSVNQLTPDMAEFCFLSDRAAEFQPGQYVMVDVPGVSGDRGYSMSNTPNDRGEWHFIIKKMPAGHASKVLFEDLKPGDTLAMDGPYGMAYLRENADREIVCIGGGSGLSPVMSIVRARAIGLTKQNLHLFHGGRTPQDMCVPQLLDYVNSPDEGIQLHQAISDPASGESWDGECCFIHELVEKTLGDSLPQFEFYFCGPPAMTEACQRMLMLDYKVPFDQIHFDRFF